MHKYQIIVYWSEDDKVFIAEVPELPGCMTHGDTQTKALVNANKAVRAWIETANRFGDSIPEPRGKRITCDGVVEPRYKTPKGRSTSLARKNNPRLIFDVKTPQSTVNPKAH